MLIFSRTCVDPSPQHVCVLHRGQIIVRVRGLVPRTAYLIPGRGSKWGGRCRDVRRRRFRRFRRFRFRLRSPGSVAAGGRATHPAGRHAGRPDPPTGATTETMTNIPTPTTPHAPAPRDEISHSGYPNPLTLIMFGKSFGDFRLAWLWDPIFVA